MRRLHLALLASILLVSACEPMRSSGREPPETANAETPEVESDRDPAQEKEHEEPAELPDEQRSDAEFDVSRAPDLVDRGIFSDLDPKVRVRFPSWLKGRDITIAHHGGASSLIAYVDGVAVGFGSPDMGELEVVSDPDAHDDDGDGIPNQLDILMGAKKTALNAAPYKGGYQGLDYPGGDVPRTEGVCTEVIIRAVRNAGIDLQKELHEDIERASNAYPMVDKPDTNIDQRRVKTLLPYFERRWEAKSTDIDDKSDWLPGDIVFMNTMRDERPDHVGIVSDELGASGYPLIINNWTNGYHTQPMDLLKFVPVTHRFRLPAAKVQFGEPTQLVTALAEHGLRIDGKHRQAVLVRAERNGAAATLTRYQRERTGRWARVGEPVEARVGRSGLGLGRGIQAPIRTGLHPKVEGDGRAPAGLFEIGTGFGRGEKAFEGDWPWRVAGEADRWVDDPESASYNTWQKAEGDWSSAEKLTNYELALVVRHNTPEPKPGDGSAIFIHDWSLDAGGTLGCTGIERGAMLELLAWLKPQASPVVVQLPR
ncbi:MAG: DUF1287 domain-containing protein [Myxococcota bacterium]